MISATAGEGERLQGQIGLPDLLVDRRARPPCRRPGGARSLRKAVSPWGHSSRDRGSTAMPSSLHEGPDPLRRPDALRVVAVNAERIDLHIDPTAVDALDPLFGAPSLPPFSRWPPGPSARPPCARGRAARPRRYMPCQGTPPGRLEGPAGRPSLFSALPPAVPRVTKMTPLKALSTTAARSRNASSRLTIWL